MEDATPVVKEMLDDAWESVLKQAAMKEALRKAPPVAGFTSGIRFVEPSRGPGEGGE